jgi:CheY-like chemotaxis protein
VALRGFSPFERNALASYFRLAGDRFPAYEQVDALQEARFIVADADHPAALQEVLDAGRAADTVFVGAQTPEGALGWMMRPIDPLHVLRELDAAVLTRQAGVGQTATVRAPQGAGNGEPEGLPMRRASDQPPPPREVAPPVLIVDEDDAASRALERQLSALGLTAVRVNNSDKALELMSRLNFRFVFTDLRLGDDSELDGLHLCQRLKRDAQGEQPVPKVFLTAAAASAVQRVRANLAGCDAMLDKPVDDGALRRALSAHGALLARQGPMRALQR